MCLAIALSMFLLKSASTHPEILTNSKMKGRDQIVSDEVLHFPVLICQTLFLKVDHNVEDGMAGTQSRVQERTRA